MLLSGTDCVVSRAVKPLLDMGYRGKPTKSLPDHQQNVTLFVVSPMFVLRWIEENIAK